MAERIASRRANGPLGGGGVETRSSSASCLHRNMHCELGFFDGERLFTEVGGNGLTSLRESPKLLTRFA